MQHLIRTSDFTKEEILNIFDEAREFKRTKNSKVLEGKIIITLFFENSTRTRSSFEIAAKRLGAEVVNLDVGTSSQKKGETMYDTVANINAMQPDAIIIRHSECGLPESLIGYVNCPIINAGDGRHSHPTQAFLDLFTIYEYFEGQTEGKKIAIVGDVRNSRVAGSNRRLLPRFGIDVNLVAPDCFKYEGDEYKQFDTISEIIDDMDIVMSLRSQLERHNITYFESLQEYARDFCITTDLMERKEFLLLHPGPVNRNIDINDDVLKHHRCKVLEQVTNGVAVRAAILKKLILNY
ncbi:aspartate carbamoyltransferase catalytic subunit [Arcobacter porcinus]|uniref:Aspartate carbamoyltransferase n=1 Tax=Arcobacter porcinus TaxID=1935204 RepID=A0A1C0AYG4_9BACT|nr:aspartate carbamoyltransferase catalytic subunit [Arcobacter porcinus]OCL90162.1 Aspartate carbamoyltransferase [Aliarcobacter thereius]OCL83239.1 Aspartate carbamoyltransferase [Arcobacter porcinus]OCL88044.1 Aspartate carbamoyltransferase [Arcobacter porcinus]OCL92674.1 Aspartate carbamoyltransferase [Arcobacter porcinus]QEP41350.1 aspartate carbamoyltransferase, catalytic subunit [Arcobacter porcinus]